MFLDCRTEGLTDELVWRRCHRFFFSMHAEKPDFCVCEKTRKGPNGKLMRTCRQNHITGVVSLSSHFPSSFSGQPVFFWGEKKKITAAWHQVWKPLPANSIWAVLTPALPPSVSGFWGKKQKQIKKPVGLLPLYKSNVTMQYIVRIWQCIPLLFYVEARWVPFIFTMWDIFDFFCLCMRELCSLLLDRFEFICALPSGTEEVETPHVVTVILPEHRGYFVQHLGYFLATFLLLAFIAVAVIVLTRRRKKRGICHCLASDNKLVLIIKDSVIQCVWRRVLNLFSRAGVWAA